MKITTDLETAGDAARVLEDVCTKLDFLRDYWRLAPWSEISGNSGTSGNWNFGVDVDQLPPKHGKSDNQRRLAEIVQPKSSSLVWFGYESHPTASRRLSVWFYCGNRKAVDRVTQRLAGKFADVKEDEDKETAQTNIVVAVTEHQKSGDRDWFISVFEAVLRPVV